MHHLWLWRTKADTTTSSPQYTFSETGTRLLECSSKQKLKVKGVHVPHAYHLLQLGAAFLRFSNSVPQGLQTPPPERTKPCANALNTYTQCNGHHCNNPPISTCQQPFSKCYTHVTRTLNSQKLQRRILETYSRHRYTNARFYTVYRSWYISLSTGFESQGRLNRAVERMVAMLGAHSGPAGRALVSEHMNER